MKQPAVKTERIAKVIARAGLCSRRDAEKWILQGRVQINNKPISHPAVNVSCFDKITVDNKPLPPLDPPRIWLYYKPRGLLTTHKDEKGRISLFSQLPEDLPRVISVGRLDMNSEGLLLLTNDGFLAHTLENPSTNWKRTYRVRVHGLVDSHQLKKISQGITIEGIHYGSIEAKLDRQQGHNAWLTVSIREGKNREIRRIMEHFGWPVSRLMRMSFGPFQLGKLKPEEVKEVPLQQIQQLLKDLEEKP